MKIGLLVQDQCLARLQVVQLLLQKRRTVFDRLAARVVVPCQAHGNAQNGETAATAKDQETFVATACPSPP